MLDQKQWNLALVRLHAMRRSIATYVDRETVAEYHDIIARLEESSGEDLSVFKISDGKITPRVTSVQMATRRRPGRAYYSEESYCPGDYFERQIEGLVAYVPQIDGSDSKQVGQIDYDRLTDEELEGLASKYNIGQYADARGFIDRRIIIIALRERDRALHTPAQPAIHIGTVTGSIIQQSPSHSPAALNYQAADVKDLTAQIRSLLETLPLDADSKAELDREIQTVELQLRSARPKNVIVHECLRSARSILEGIGGSLIATEIVHKITQLIGH